jgi:hypothetical protein
MFWKLNEGWMNETCSTPGRDEKCKYIILIGKSEEKRSIGRPRSR